MKDYIVADAGDVLLVCPKADEQTIKQYVNDVKLAYGDNPRLSEPTFLW